MNNLDREVKLQRFKVFIFTELLCLIVLSVFFIFLPKVINVWSAILLSGLIGEIPPIKNSAKIFITSLKHFWPAFLFLLVL